MYEPESVVEEPQISKYNEAFGQLKRINALWQRAHHYATQNMFLSWNGVLDRVWCELGADFKAEGTEEKNFLKINDDLHKAGILSDGETNGFTSPTDFKQQDAVKQKQYLVVKELFLRRLQNQSGKGTAYKDRSEDFFS